MKQYTVGVTVRHKKLLKVSAHSKDEAIIKAELTLFDTDAVKFDSDDLVSTDIGIESPGDNFDDDEDDMEKCDIYCSGCPDYVPSLNICKNMRVCGEEYGFSAASGSKDE